MYFIVLLLLFASYNNVYSDTNFLINNIKQYDKKCIIDCKIENNDFNKLLNNNCKISISNNNCRLEAYESFNLLNSINKFDNETDFYNINWALIGLIRSESWNYYSKNLFSSEIIKYLKNIICHEKNILYESDNFFRTLLNTNELVLRSYNNETFKDIFLHLSEFNNGFYIWNPTIKIYKHIMQFYTIMKKELDNSHKNIINQSIKQLIDIGKNVFVNKNLNPSKLIVLKNIIKYPNLNVYTDENYNLNIDYNSIINTINAFNRFNFKDNSIIVNVYILKNKEAFDLYNRQENPDKYYYEDDGFYEIHNTTATNTIVNIYAYNSVTFSVFFKELYNKAIIRAYFLIKNNFCNTQPMPLHLKYGYKNYCDMDIIKSLLNNDNYNFKENILDNPKYSSIILKYLLDKKSVNIFENYNYIDQYDLYIYAQNLLKKCNGNYNLFSDDIFQNFIRCKTLTFNTLYYNIIVTNRNMYIEYNNKSNIVSKEEYNNFVNLLKIYIINNNLNKNANYFPKKYIHDNYIQNIKCNNVNYDDSSYIKYLYNILSNNGTITEINNCYTKPVIINKPINTKLKNLLTNSNYNKKELLRYKNTEITDLSCNIKTVNDYIKLKDNTCSDFSIINEPDFEKTINFFTEDEKYDLKNKKLNNEPDFEKNIKNFTKDKKYNLKNKKVNNDCMMYYNMYKMCLLN